MTRSVDAGSMCESQGHAQHARFWAEFLRHRPNTLGEPRFSGELEQERERLLGAIACFLE